MYMEISAGKVLVSSGQQPNHLCAVVRCVFFHSTGSTNQPPMGELMKEPMSNRKFADTNVLFRKACELAKVPPTKRQASKFRNHVGQAEQMRGSALRSLGEAK